MNYSTHTEDEGEPENLDWEWRLLEAIIKKAILDTKSNAINEVTGAYDIRNKACEWIASRKFDKYLSVTGIDANYIRERVTLQKKPPMSAEKLKEFLEKKYGKKRAAKMKAMKKLHGLNQECENAPKKRGAK